MKSKRQLLSEIEGVFNPGAGKHRLRLFIEPIDESSCVYYKSCFSSELHEDTNIFTNDIGWADTILKMHCGGEGFVETPPPEPDK